MCSSVSAAAACTHLVPGVVLSGTDLYNNYYDLEPHSIVPGIVLCGAHTHGIVEILDRISLYPHTGWVAGIRG